MHSRLAGRIPKTIGYVAAFVALGMALAATGPALPSLAANVRSGLSQISIMFTLRSLGYLLAATIVARSYDRVPGHPVMAGALVLMAASTALMPVAPVLWLLVLIALFYGIAEGMVDIGGNTLLVWVHRTNLGPWMNSLHLAFGVGALLSPILVVQSVAITGGISWAFWIMALVMLPVAGWLLLLPSPPIRGQAAEDRENGTDYRLVVALSLIFFLYVGAEGSVGGWIYTYTVTLFEGTELSAGYLTSAFWGALAVGRLLAIPISARFAPRSILIVDFLGCIASIGLILALPGSLAAVWVGTLGTGLFMASVFPTLLTFADHRLAITAKVNGLFFVGASLGGMALPWLIGQFFEPAGPRTAMIIIQAALLVGLGTVTAVAWATRPRRVGVEA